MQEYQAAQAQLKEARATLEYLDNADRQDAAQGADAVALEASCANWVTQADKDPGVARQMLRRVLAAPIAVRPTGNGTWAFAGFSKFDGVLEGGLGKGGAWIVQRDAQTAASMMQWLVYALGVDVPVPSRPLRIRALISEPDDEIPPISGGSDAEHRGSQVGSCEGPPIPPGATPRRGP